MVRRSARLAPAQSRAVASASIATAPMRGASAQVTAAPMKVAHGPHPAPLPINPDAPNFLDLAGEIRNQIYAELLPQKSVDSVDGTQRLRYDEQKTSTNFMATCHQVYEEALSLLYPPVIESTLRIKVNGAGTVKFLGSKTRLAAMRPSNLSAITRAKRLRLQIEISGSMQATSACDVQDAMFHLSKILEYGHRLECISVNVSIGTSPETDRVLDNLLLNNWWMDFMFGCGWGDQEGANLGLMQEFRNVKPGDISRAHIAAFLTDPLRMIRGVKNGPKNKTFALQFPGRTGTPWKELEGQVYNLIRSNTPVLEFAAFSKYFDALRQLRRVFYCFESKAKDQVDTHKEIYEKHAAKLAEARIRGNAPKFREAHLALIPVLDSNIAMRSEFDKIDSYHMAELYEYECRELVYLKIELEAALPGEDLAVSHLGYNIADAGLHEWQTVGRKEKKEAKRKRKAEEQARADEAKKAKLDVTEETVESG